MPATQNIIEGKKMKSPKRFYKQQLAERKRKKWLAEKLEQLTDDTLIDRMLEEPAQEFSEEEVQVDENLQTAA